MEVGGVHASQLVLVLLLLVVVAFGALARKMREPYPIVLLVAGALVSLIPGIPRPTLDPDVIFFLVLPPLLYAGAWNTSWRGFSFNLVSIVSLAVGLVSFTVAGVAVAAPWMVPGFDWQAGFVLGAVVSPTDAIAATSTAKEMGLPRRVADVLEGESLVNDATGLLALEFGVLMLAWGSPHRRRGAAADRARAGSQGDTPAECRAVNAVLARQCGGRMDPVGKARRIRIYVKESDVIGHRPAPYALLDWLRREGAAGATLIRATAGIGASGHLDLDLTPDLGPHLPAIVEWIDSPDRVERLLPQLKQMVGRGLITGEDTEILLYKAHGVRSLPDTVTVEQVMSRDVVSVSPDAHLQEVIELVEGRVYRAVPVVENGRPIGMITNLDLVERGGLLARIELLGSLSDAERSTALNLLGRKTAREVMTANPVTVVEGATLPAVAEVMAHKRLKRLPVVDAAGRLVGIVSRLDLLRTVAEAFQTSPEDLRPAGLRGDLALSRVMRKDVPVVHPDTPINEVLQAVVSTRLNRALVVDTSRRVVGIVTDEEVLDRVTPGMRPTALKSLMHRLPFSHVAKAESEAEQHARAKKAADLMLTDVAIARDDQLLRDAIAPMMKAPHKLVAVVGEDGQLVGALDRADILRGLIQE